MSKVSISKYGGWILQDNEETKEDVIHGIQAR